MKKCRALERVFYHLSFIQIPAKIWWWFFLDRWLCLYVSEIGLLVISIAGGLAFTLWRSLTSIFNFLLFVMFYVVLLLLLLSLLSFVNCIVWSLIFHWPVAQPLSGGLLGLYTYVILCSLVLFVIFHSRWRRLYAWRSSTFAKIHLVLLFVLCYALFVYFMFVLCQLTLSFRAKRINWYQSLGWQSECYSSCFLLHFVGLICALPVFVQLPDLRTNPLQLGENDANSHCKTFPNHSQFGPS